MSSEKTKPPKILFLVGPDGVGKTTLADRLVRELLQRGVRARRSWSRYNNYVSKPLLALARILRLSYTENHDGERVGYHDFFKSNLIGALFVFLQAIDVNIATYFKVVRRIPRDGILICDRGPYDTLFDVMLDTGFYHLGQTKWLGVYTWLVRDRCLVFLVRRDYEKTLSSGKAGLRHDRNLHKKRSLYDSYAGTLSMSNISNNGSRTDAVNHILGHLELAAIASKGGES